MGFDLVRKKAYFYFNYDTWWDIISLAVGCGWEPTGTGPPRGVLLKNWPGVYFSNDGQLLYARDARRLADILQKVVDAPTVDSLEFASSRLKRWRKSPVGRQASKAMQRFRELVDALGASGTGKKTRSPSRSQLWILSGDGKSSLRDFIRFCRGGSFRIY